MVSLAVDAEDFVNRVRRTLASDQRWTPKERRERLAGGEWATRADQLPQIAESVAVRAFRRSASH